MIQKKIGKMRLFFCALAAMVMCFAQPMAHAIPTPPSTNLVEWFRADAVAGVANGGAVPTWVDQAAGGGSQTATAAGTTPTLVLNAANGLPALDFAGPAGGGRYVTSGSPGITATGGSVYVLVVATDTFSNSTNFVDRSPGANPLMTLHATGSKFALQKRFDNGSGLADVLSTTNINTSGDYQIVTWRRNTGASQFEIYVNGVLEGTAADPGPNLTPDAPVIGGHASFPNTSIDGRIAEFLVYNDSLSAADLQGVHAYLDNKYFGQPYKAISGLFNTGVDNNGAPLAGGAGDQHYVLTVNPDNTGSTPVVEDSTVFPIVAGPWIANSATSKWIGPRLNTAGSAGGNYEYTLTFDLGGLDPETAYISGSWATDNGGLDILINGVTTGFTSGGFGSLSPFLITDGFSANLNTLTFRLNNSSTGYTGLRVENLQGFAQVVPEPATATLGLLGLAGLMMRRRRMA